VEGCGVGEVVMKMVMVLLGTFGYVHTISICWRDAVMT
jgi:hypothetical protein